MRSRHTVLGASATRQGFEAASETSCGDQFRCFRRVAGRVLTNFLKGPLDIPGDLGLAATAGYSAGGVLCLVAATSLMLPREGAEGGVAPPARRSKVPPRQRLRAFAV